MSQVKRTFIWGLTAGAVAGLADVLLITLMDSSATAWVLLQPFLFWSIAGGVVVGTRTGLGPRMHALVVTVLLNLPWFVASGPGSGKPKHVPPLLVMSLVFGTGLGWTVARARGDEGVAAARR